MDQIYYLGVKSEDQQGAEFGVVGLSTDTPFDEPDPFGNRILHGIPRVWRFRTARPRRTERP